ncbi:hypothetical protein DSM106972_055160 [Dulcicalothrix desertica PCC 7102]|uniref:Uncharacterized protein n=1 Tax=Dulcicalothrix desertica PCC 7102 TaxID=232991 RepID=A0A433VAW8_9CYAN|nr:hypothetical protein [Dulcicalothrix desertica]RUT03208.1 hypothetical protein DSM106972_055160 [Dulcicalothrix desertica PCC 7102]TWH53578.1 hypothetical protein CAL7102_01542 [Dulcicalothrix desertica PCC 7102]
MNASCYQAKGVGNIVTLFKAREAKAPYNVTPTRNVVKVEVIDSDDLSYDEEQERIILENLVERAFYEAGKALRCLRDKKLYRSTHKTFEEYCRKRFGYTRIAAVYKIAAANVVDNLLTNGYQNPPDVQEPDLLTNGYQILPDVQEPDLLTNGYQILPTSERQVRPLVALEPDEQRNCWKLAVEKVGGKVPSGRVVKDIVDKIRERTEVKNPYRKGEICVLLPKNNPDLKGKGGCWGAITHVGDYSCTIETWDGEYTVKIQHLLSLNLYDDGCKFMQDLVLRLRRLHASPNRDSATDSLLAFFGKEHKTYLTDAQEELLTILERKAKLIQ